jgi:hypothetical protein
MLLTAMLVDALHATLENAEITLNRVAMNRWHFIIDILTGAVVGCAVRIVNGRWNLNPVDELLHRRLHGSSYNWIKRTGIGSPVWARQAVGTGVAASAAGAIGEGLDDNCSCTR